MCTSISCQPGCLEIRRLCSCSEHDQKRSPEQGVNFGGCFHVCGSQLELNVYFFKKPILGTLPSLSPKHAKSFPEAILKDLQTQPQKSFQDASRRPFKDIHAQTQRSIQRTTNRQADIQTGTTYHWHWRAMVVIDKLWLSLTSYGCHWRATVVIGEP